MCAGRVSNAPIGGYALGRALLNQRRFYSRISMLNCVVNLSHGHQDRFFVQHFRSYLFQLIGITRNGLEIDGQGERQISVDQSDASGVITPAAER